MDFSDPKAGILECSWRIEGSDKAEAIQKFVEHLIRLKRQFSHAPLSIADSDDPAIIGRELFRRLFQITEPIAYVLTLHLLWSIG